MSEENAVCSRNSYRSVGTILTIVSFLLSALVMVLIYRVDLLVAVGCGIMFLMSAILLLRGKVLPQIIYCLFLIHFPISFFAGDRFNLSLYMTVSCLLFFPFAIGMPNTRHKELSSNVFFPNKKSLLLLLSGMVITYIYFILTNGGKLNYYLEYDVYFLLGLVSIYLLYYLFNVKILDAEKLVSYIAVSGIVLVFVIIIRYQLIGVLDIMFSERFGWTVRINPNVVASYIDMTFATAFFIAFLEKNSCIKRIFFYAVAAFSFIVIMATASRGSLPGLAIIVAYAIWRKRSKRLILLCILACALIAISPLGVTMIERVLSPNELDSISSLGRVEMIRSALKILSEQHYFFGVGINNYGLMKYNYGFPWWIDRGVGVTSHNLYLEIWLGWGLPGLLGWLAFNFTVVSALLRKHKNNGAACGVAFAIIAFSVHGLFDCMIPSYSVMLTYFSLVAAGLFFVMQDASSATIAQH